MGLDANQLGIVGFILADHPVSGEKTPIGTAFAVSVPHGDNRAAFLVTARHVVDGHDKVYAALPTTGDTPPAGWALTNQWFFPPDGRVDLAVHPLFKPTDGDFRLKSVWPIEMTSDSLGVMPRHGERVYIAGLHVLLEQTWRNMTPLTRTATLAAPYQQDVSWGNEPTWGPATVHLVDGLFWGGYSGSPVFLEARAPGPQSAATPELPRLLTDDLLAVGGPPREELGTIYALHAILGILVAMESVRVPVEAPNETDEELLSLVHTGIGIVLPAQYLTKLLGSSQVTDWLASQPRPPPPE